MNVLAVTWEPCNPLLRYFGLCMVSTQWAVYAGCLLVAVSAAWLRKRTA